MDQSRRSNSIFNKLLSLRGVSLTNDMAIPAGLNNNGIASAAPRFRNDNKCYERLLYQTD
jgi:hypothetical protein